MSRLEQLIRMQLFSLTPIKEAIKWNNPFIHLSFRRCKKRREANKKNINLTVHSVILYEWLLTRAHLKSSCISSYYLVKVNVCVSSLTLSIAVGSRFFLFFVCLLFNLGKDEVNATYTLWTLKPPACLTLLLLWLSQCFLEQIKLV